jgi:hypothetical protein
MVKNIEVVFGKGNNIQENLYLKLRVSFTLDGVAILVPPLGIGRWGQGGWGRWRAVQRSGKDGDSGGWTRWVS